MIDKIKAAAAITLIGVIWGSMIIAGGAFHLGAYVHDRHYNLSGKDGWQYSLLLIEDIAINVLFGNYFRTTISSELGNLQQKGSKAGTETALFVNWLFYTLTGETNHCINAIEAEDIHRFKPIKAVLGSLTYFITIYLILG